MQSHIFKEFLNLNLFLTTFNRCRYRNIFIIRDVLSILMYRIAPMNRFSRNISICRTELRSVLAGY